MRIMTLIVVSLVMLGSHLLGSATLAADWPQFRYDANRSAASPEQLAEELHLQWVRELPTPRPAFPNEIRLRFDASYEPVVSGKTLFVPSMVSDSVAALDTETGNERWRFFTDGPIRFAPVAWEGKLYVASDDGHLYCLRAEDGKLIWKFRGLPEGLTDRKLLGNQRLISLWPARGGPVLAGGIVFFAAGIWTDDGVVIYALDAASGEVVWSNANSNRIPRANMDHGVAQDAGLAPQGYLAVVSDKLIVPCGAQLAAFLDLKTGKLGDYTTGWGGPPGSAKGSWFVAGAGKYLSHSGDLYDITRANDEKFSRPPKWMLDSRLGNFKPMLYPGGFTRLQIDPANQRFLAVFRQPVITQEAMYYNDHEKGIVAYDLTEVTLEERSKSQPTKHRAKDQFPDKWKGVLRQLWNLPSKLEVHIKVGGRLYLGGEGVVEAVDVPDEGTEPNISWRAEIKGSAHRMLAADGKLFVVTLEGRIYAFGEKKPENMTVHAGSKPTSPAEDQWIRQATEILKETNQEEGYAMVFGLDRGRLVEELIRQSQLYVIAVDRDSDKVTRLREKLYRAGLYGTRASVHVGDPLSYPFPPYLANLVVSEHPIHENPAFSKFSNSGVSGHRAFAEAVFHPLRPYGGSACFLVSAEQRASAIKDLTATKLAGAVVREAGDYVLLTRQGALPDAANWSHAGANAANSGASQDRFLKAPLALLWYDGSIRWNRKPGSAVVRVADGRIFIEVFRKETPARWFVKVGRLHAIDVYTGRHLWHVELPASRPNDDNLVAVKNGVYLSAGATCVVLEPASGRKIAEIRIPADTAGRWSNIRVWQDRLVGTVGKHLVCVNRNSGEVAWKFKCGRTALSTAVGRGKVFCAELINERRGETAEKSNLKTRAFDVETGEVLWRITSGSEIRYSETHDLLVTSSGIYQGKDGRRLRDGIASAQIVGDQLVSGSTVTSKGAKKGRPDTFAVYDLLSGDRQGDELKWFRRGCTGMRFSCNLVTTRFKGNAAYVDLETRDIISLWNIRSGCNNNLYPANGILNVPNVTGGCECNYTPTSMAFAPLSVIKRVVKRR